MGGILNWRPLAQINSITSGRAEKRRRVKEWAKQMESDLDDFSATTVSQMLLNPSIDASKIDASKIVVNSGLNLGKHWSGGFTGNTFSSRPTKIVGEWSDTVTITELYPDPKPEPKIDETDPAVDDLGMRNDPYFGMF